jgi:hypothetical protein
MAQLHTQLMKLSEHYAMFGELNVYANNPHDLEALKQNIHEAIYNIRKHELQQVSRNLFKRIQAYHLAEGRYFEHL